MPNAHPPPPSPSPLDLAARLELLERSVAEVRIRLGLDPPTSGAVAFGTAGVVLQPNQAPKPTALDLQLAKMDQARARGILPLVAALARYDGEELLTVYFPQRMRLNDTESYDTIQVEPGWARVPKRFQSQLAEGRAQIVPQEFAN